MNLVQTFTKKPTERGPFLLSIVKIYSCCLLRSPREIHVEVPPHLLPSLLKKKIAGTVNNNPETIQMGKHFQNWLYRELLTRHYQAKSGGWGDFGLPLDSGHTRQDGDRVREIRISVVMHFVVCRGPLEGPESYLVQATPDTPEERKAPKG